MRLDSWLALATEKLAGVGIGTARLDALVLLEDASTKDRAWLLANPEFELDAKHLRQLDSRLERRAGHEPLSYIRGKTEFYGREFFVNSDVLEPRPETETMIDLFKSLDIPAGAQIVDVGTGSGAIGITVQLERPDLAIVLTDIDEKCLQIADKNVRKHKLSLKLLRLDLLNHASGPYDVILANLPYVPDSHTINEAAMHEPKIAIFGGEDGLDLYRRLFEQLTTSPWHPAYVLTEALPFQHAELTKIARKAGFKTKRTDDFIQLFAR